MGPSDPRAPAKWHVRRVAQCRATSCPWPVALLAAWTMEALLICQPAREEYVLSYANLP